MRVRPGIITGGVRLQKKSRIEEIKFKHKNNPICREKRKKKQFRRLIRMREHVKSKTRTLWCCQKQLNVLKKEIDHLCKNASDKLSKMRTKKLPLYLA